MKVYFILVIFSIFIFFPSGIKAQKNKNHTGQHKLDSIRVKAGYYFVIEKDAYYVERDTVFVVADTLHCYQKKRATNDSDKLYGSLEARLAKGKYSNLLYKLLFEQDEERLAEEQAQEKLNFEKSHRRYLAFDGKKVNHIRVRKLQIFGTSVDDTTKLETSWVTQTINGVHFNTRDRVIRQNLLLKKGHILEPNELADNERLIRQLDFIKDARIYVNGGSNGDDADLYVVTRDLFPLKFDYNTNPETSTSSIGISNINIFGTGHEQENNIVINDIGESRLGYDGYYRVNNIAGSFLMGELNYISTFRSEGMGLKLFRTFFTPEIKHAGGLEISSKHHNQLRAFDNVTDSITTLSHKENRQDFWFARSFKPFKVPSFFDSRGRLRFIVSGRVTRSRFAERPETRHDFNQAFHDRTNLLMAVGLSSRGYYKDRLIKRFGRTEDIPVGTSLQLTAGRQIGEFFDRTYVGLDISEGTVFQKFGYVKGTVQWGGFYRNSKLEQGVFKAKVDYFTRLYNLNLFKLRQFVTIHYTAGIRRKAQDFIDINDANGIRGVYNFYLTGTERFVINTESVLFTPFYLAGFRTAFLGFFDLGVLNSQRADNVNYGFGFGLRMKNDNLALNTIQLRLGFYSGMPFQPAGSGFNFSTIGSFGLEDFDISRPEIVRFR